MFSHRPALRCLAAVAVATSSSSIAEAAPVSAGAPPRLIAPSGAVGTLTTAKPLTFTTPVATSGIAVRWRIKKCNGSAIVRFTSGSRQLRTQAVIGARTTTATLVWHGAPLPAESIVSARLDRPGKRRGCGQVQVQHATLAAAPDAVQTAGGTSSTQPDSPAGQAGSAASTAGVSVPATVLTPGTINAPTAATFAPAATTPSTEVSAVDPAASADPPTSTVALPAKSWFSATSIWNAPVSADAAVSPMSSTYVQTLVNQALHGAASPWIEHDRYTTPVYRVSASQPAVKVTLDTNWARLQDEFLSVPLPDDAVPASGADGHMVVWQASTDTMWEFWKMRKAPDGWHARWGGRIANLSSNPGYYQGTDSANGATATGLPLLGGLMTIDELRNQQINHALAMAIPVAAKSFVAPALRSDGGSTAASAIPEGTRFRVDPKLNVDAMDVTPVTKAIVRAAQTYGIIVRDQTASSVNFYSEATTTPNDTSYARPNGVFGSQWADNIMRSFPWASLEVVAP